MEIAKKISVGTINGMRGGFVCDYEKSKEPFFAARIVGIASAVETKVTTYGDSLKFTGEFQATNMDGEIVAAPVAYLVAPADGMLKDALISTKQPVRFAFDIYVQPTPKKNPGDRGYEYKVKPLLESKPSDPLGEMLQGLPAPAVKPKQPQLTGTETPDPAPAPAPIAAPAEAEHKGKVKK